MAPAVPAPVVGPVGRPVVGPRVRKVRIGGQKPELAKAAAVLRSLDGRPEPERAAPLPDPTALVCRVVRAALEVLRGDRPATQLARWVTPAVYDQLLERGRLLRRAQVTRPPAHPTTVRRVRVEIGDGGTSAEATVILHDGERVRAAAARLEAHRGVWRVACLELA